MIQQRGEVLVVDDEASIRDTLQRLMAAQGHRVAAAASGQEAVKCLTEREFDVILLDVKMPGTSGMDVLQEVHGYHPNTSVIMVTAVAQVQTVIDAMKLGAYDYIVKPFNLDDVSLKVGKALEHRALVLQNLKYQHHLEEMVEEQRVRLRRQFEQLIHSLAREHTILYELESSRSPRGRLAKSLETLPPELRKPADSVQQFAAALLHLMEEGRFPQTTQKPQAT